MTGKPVTFHYFPLYLAGCILTGIGAGLLAPPTIQGALGAALASSGITSLIGAVIIAIREAR